MTTDAPSGTARAGLLLDFWFGAPGSTEHDRPREIWFRAHAAFDAELRDRFLADHEAAAAGHLVAWLAAPDTCLALILLLDQLPRNLFRGAPSAYRCDAAARAAAAHAVDRGFDRAAAAVRRWFFYLPFQHSENLADQRRSLELFASLPPHENRDISLSATQRHYDIIARFGRFPHRNDVLGRPSTAEETAFLREPGSRF